MAKSLGSQRGKRGRRPARRTILLVTNGEITERAYLERMKKASTLPDASITVRVIPGEPPSLIRKLSSPKGDLSDFDEVWIVVDEDGVDRRDFMAQCRRLSNRHTEVHGIVSRPCFEVWLVAHYRQVRSYQDQHDVQRHFRELIPKGTGPKKLPQDFPFDEAETAIDRCRLPGSAAPKLDALPPDPGSAMPHLVRALRIKSSGN